MATPTRPCPYCGAAVLMNAAACGTCGRPMPAAPGAPPAGGGGPAKTMFGYAAPVLKPGQQPGGAPPPAQPPGGAPRPPGPPMGGQPPGAPGGFPGQPPQQGGFGAPPQPGGFPGQPPQQGGFGAPQPGGFPGQPPQPGGFPGQPPQHGGAPGGFPGQPPQQGGFGAPQPGGFPGQPPQHGGFPGQPPQQGGFPGQPPQHGGGFPGQPPQQGGGFSGQPPQQGFGQPPPPMGQPPGGFGQPPPPMGQPGHPPMGAAPGAPAGYGQPQPGYPPPQQAFPPPGGGGFPPPPGQPGYQAPGQNLPGPLDNIARGLPQSAPGTIFGISVSRLRDTALQRKALFVLGIALAASAFLPVMTEPRTVWPWDVSTFKLMIWPLIAGGAYWVVAAAPEHIRQKFPPVVLQWLPFAVSFLGIQITGLGLAMLGAPGGIDIFPTMDYFYTLGFATLIFAMLARIANPTDQIARIIMGVGAAFLAIAFFQNLHTIGKFSFFGKSMAIMGIHNHLMLLVLLIGALTLLYFVPPQKLPPALQALDALAPAIAALLILWLPLSAILMFLSSLLEGGKSEFINSLLFLARQLLVLAGYFGVLMLTAPAAYDELVAMFKKGSAPPPSSGGGYPPPPGGGYPPPPGGGYPPPGGGYPPPGGGYPPPQGGGWPQQ